MSRWRVIGVPEEWKTAPPLATREPLTGRFDCDSAPLSVSAVLLEDGSNIYALLFPGGQRLARTTADTDWAIEERFVGQPPKPQHTDTVDRVWRMTFDAMRAAAADARAELEGEDDDGPVHERTRAELRELYRARDQQQPSRGSSS